VCLTPFCPDQFVKSRSGESKNVKERLLISFLCGEDLTASGGGHTLRSHDLGMILAWHGNGVSDGEHSANVMKQNEWDFVSKTAIRKTRGPAWYHTDE
jgi:hypothetical protein